MKNRLKLACLLLGLLSLTTSCSDDDDNGIDEIVSGIVEDGEEAVDGAIEDGEEAVDGAIEDGEEVVDGATEDGEEAVEVRSTVVINEVSYLGTDWIEIYNPTSETIDVTEYQICLGPGMYRQLTEVELISGDLVLESGSYLALNLNEGDNPLPLSDESGSVAIYNQNGAFTNPEAIVDFVQYGAGGTGRESVAVSAGLWTAGDFLPVVSSETNTIVYQGEGIGVGYWSETTVETIGEENDIVAP